MSKRPDHPLRQILIYSVPTVLRRGVGLILLPLYTACLTVEQFGQYELMLTLTMFLMFGTQFGWETAYTRFHHDPDVDAHQLSRTMLVFRLAANAPLFGAVGLLSPDRVANWATGSADLGMVVVCVLVLGLGRDVFRLYAYYLRSTVQAAWYAAMQSGAALMQLGCIAAALVVFELGVMGIFLGQAAGLILALVPIAAIKSRQIFSGWTGAWLDRRLLGQCLRLGAPLVPAALAMFLVAAADRWMLLWLSESGAVGQRHVGIYGLGLKAIMLIEVATGGFQVFLGPYVYRQFRKRTGPRRLAWLFGLYNNTIFLIAMLLLANLGWVMPLVFESYVSATPVIPIVLCGYMLYRTGDYFSVGVMLVKQSVVRAQVAVAAAVVNVVLNFVLIPHFAIYGAASASAVSYLAFSAWMLGAHHQRYPTPYRLELMVAASAIVGGSTPVAIVAPRWLPAYCAVGLVLYWAVYRSRRRPLMVRRKLVKGTRYPSCRL